MVVSTRAASFFHQLERDYIMYLPTPSGIDTQVMAIAVLSGLAGTGLMSTRRVDDVNVIESAGNLTDYREGLSELFLDAIRTGNIRCDAKWSYGADPVLVELANAASKAEPDA